SHGQYLPAPGGHSRLGGDVCNLAEPLARRSTGRRPPPVCSLSAAPQDNLQADDCCADPARAVLLDRVDSLGGHAASYRPAPGSGGLAGDWRWAPVVGSVGAPDVGSHLHLHSHFIKRWVTVPYRGDTVRGELLAHTLSSC